MGDFHSEGKIYRKTFFMLELVWLGLVFPDALGQDLIETQQNFDHEVEVDDNKEIENIENLSQNLNDSFSKGWQWGT